MPVAQVNLVVLSGSADDPPGKFGVASLTTAMLEEGAGSRSSLEIADAVDFLGADLGAGSTFDLVGGPAARAGGAARRRAADHGRRRAAADLPEGRARAAAPAAAHRRCCRRATIRRPSPRWRSPRVLYGTSHRFGTAHDGHRGDDQGVHRPTICAPSTRRAFRPDNATLIVVGDVTPDKVMPLLEKSFGSWKAAGPAARA